MLRDDIEIAKRAIEKGFISSDQLREVLAQKGGDTQTTVGRRDPVPIGTLLVQSGYLKADQLATLISEVKGVPTPAPDATPSAPAARQADAPPPTGSQTFGKFMLVNRLGEGRTGTLYRAWQKNLRRWVTLRLPRPGSTAERALFIEGAQRAAMLEHANILRTFEVGLQDQMPFAAMEFLKGKTLDQALTMPQRRLVEIVHEAASAIQFAHERNVAHGNIKPSNIILAETGDSAAPERVVVLDFAIPAYGTCPYTPPEMVSSANAPTVAGDVYMIGATLYHALAGRPPYDGPAPIDIAAQIVQSDAPPPKSVDAKVPGDLDGIVRKAMARAPEQRHPSMKDFCAELKAWLRRSAASTVSTSRKRVRAAAARGSKKLVVIVAVIAIVAVALVLAVLFSGNRTKKGAGDGSSSSPNGSTDGSGDPHELGRPAFEEARRKLLAARELLYRPTTTMEPYFASIREALALLDKSVKAAPGFADAHVERGRALTLLGRRDDAETAFTRAIEADGKLATGWLGRADALLRRIDDRVEMHRTREVARRRKESTAATPPDPFTADAALRASRDRAVSDLRAAVDRQPEPLEVTRAKALIRLLEWDLLGAREVADGLVRDYPNQERVWVLRGRIRRTLAMEQLGTGVPEGEREERYARALGDAAADFEHVVTMQVNDLEARLLAADTLAEQHTSDGLNRALKLYGDALRLDTKNPAAYYQLAQCHVRLGQPRDAKQNFARCSELLPSQKEYLLLRAMAAWSARDALDLEDAARRLRDGFPTEPLSWVFSAMRHYLDNNPDAAESMIVSGLQKAPGDPTLYHVRGVIAEARDRRDEAVDAYARALAANKNLVRTRVMLAQVHLTRGDAKAALNELAPIDKPDPWILAAMGAYLLLAGELQQAAAVLQRASQGPNHTIYAVGNSGLAHLWLGERERAIQVLEQAAKEARTKSVATAPEETGNLRRFWYPILVHLARAYLEDRRAVEAVRVAEEAVLWESDAAVTHAVLADAYEAKGDTAKAQKERALAKDGDQVRGLVMLARHAWIDVAIAHARPGWDPVREEYTSDLGMRRQVLPVPKR